MKRLPALIALGLACHPAAPAAELTLAEENAARARESEEIRDAATAFCTELRRERVEGLPSVGQMKRLAPLVTPELNDLIERARALQEEQIRKYPDEKPSWIEGDLFSSSFEGVSDWKTGEVLNAPMADATVKVSQSYRDPGEKPVLWTDTLVFRKRGQGWLLDDILMGGEWAFKSGASLRSTLPGGGKEGQDHDSLDERWHVAFTREGDVVTRITIAPTDKSAPPVTLFGDKEGETCPKPTWVVWGPGCDMLALRLGESPRFTRTLVFRHVSSRWQPVALPAFYPKERATMVENGFRECDRLLDAERWEDANTLVVRYFGSYTNDDDGDGFYKDVSVRIDAEGKATVVGSVDVPGEE
jgi:hypothetical protein